MSDPLDLPATPARLRAALDTVGAPPAAHGRARVIASATPSPAAWTRFLAQALLLIGAALLLSGIVCFFAFNWASLDRFAKFAVLEAAVAVCAVIGWWRLRDLAGRVALFSAAVLVGPLLGVYGQTYQTGADPWGLFAFWALLIVPWVIAAHFTALWMLAIVLADVALVLFSVQVLEPESSGVFYLLCLLAFIHAVAVAAWEWQRRRTVPWLDETWAPRVLVAAAFAMLLVPATIFLLEEMREGAEAAAVGLAAFWAAVALTFAWYRRGRPDLFMLTAAGGSVLVFLAFAFGRLIFVEMRLETEGFLLMAMFVLAEVGIGVAWLRRLFRGGGPAPERVGARVEGTD